MNKRKLGDIPEPKKKQEVENPSPASRVPDEIWLDIIQLALDSESMRTEQEKEGQVILKFLTPCPGRTYFIKVEFRIEYVKTYFLFRCLSRRFRNLIESAKTQHESSFYVGRPGSLSVTWNWKRKFNYYGFSPVPKAMATAELCKKYHAGRKKDANLKVFDWNCVYYTKNFICYLCGSINYYNSKWDYCTMVKDEHGKKRYLCDECYLDEG